MIEMQGINTPPIKYLTSHSRTRTGGEQTGWDFHQCFRWVWRGCTASANQGVPRENEMQGINTPPIKYLTSHPRASRGGGQTGWDFTSRSVWV